MLHKKYFVFFFIVMAIGLFSAPLQAQNDTLFYDNNWKEVSRPEASFFRPPVQQVGSLYAVEDYYLNGQVQMRATSKSKTKDIWEGGVTWYNLDGSVFQKGHYKNGLLDGPFITYNGAKELVSNYENGYMVSGKMIARHTNYSLQTQLRNDTTITTYFDEDLEGIRYEEYSTKKKGNFLSMFYGKGGELIGERIPRSNGYIKGVDVYYYYNPMRVKQIVRYPSDNLTVTDFFYPNGQVREKTTVGPNWLKTYYNRDGSVMGTLEYKLDRDYLTPWNGTEFNFEYAASSEITDVVTLAQTYVNGKLTLQETKYENGTTKSKTVFKEGVRQNQISFDEDGKVLARMEYKNYLPFNGKEITENKIALYDEGALVEETTFYPKTELPFVKKTETTETYFDREGNTLGKLKINFEDGYGKPLEGKRITLGYDGEISRIEVYENGRVNERTNFVKRLAGKDEYEIFKSISYFGFDGYTPTREIQFYSNGIKQSDIDFEGYDKVAGTYFNKQGNEMASYDYKRKDGTLYEFFGESDEVKLIETYRDGVLQKAKRYDYGTGSNSSYGKIVPVLLEDIDINCCAVYYNREGEQIANLVYKNTIPWEGTIYDNSTREKFTISEGKKNGTYQKLDYASKILEEGKYKNNLREGLFSYYDYSGSLLKTENYSNDLLNGISVFYETDGTIISRMEYDKGQPIEGTVILNRYGAYDYIQETYSRGKITEKITFDSKGKTQTVYPEGKSPIVTSYFDGTDIKQLQYSIKDDYLDGEVIRYSQDGKVLHKALLDQGNFLSGTLFTTSYYDSKVLYAEVTKTDKGLTVLFRDAENAILFKGEEYMIPGGGSYYLDRLDVKTNYLTHQNLYR